MKITFSYVEAGIHPKLGKVFHRQPRAEGGVDNARYNKYICEVLDAIAQSVDSCNQLLDCIEKIESGAQSEIKSGGNDVTLTINSTGVQVDIDVFDDWVGQTEGHFHLVEWRKTLEGWRTFLQMPKSPESIVEVIL